MEPVQYRAPAVLSASSSRFGSSRRGLDGRGGWAHAGGKWGRLLDEAPGAPTRRAPGAPLGPTWCSPRRPPGHDRCPPGAAHSPARRDAGAGPGAPAPGRGAHGRRLVVGRGLSDRPRGRGGRNRLLRLPASRPGGAVCAGVCRTAGRRPARRTASARGPALVHGDLWWGNVLFGAGDHAWLIDPSVHGGHPEETWPCSPSSHVSTAVQRLHILPPAHPSRPPTPPHNTRRYPSCEGVDLGEVAVPTASGRKEAWNELRASCRIDLARRSNASATAARLSAT